MKPDWAIRANGKDVTAAFKPYLISIRARDESKDESDSVSITVSNQDGKMAQPQQGDELEILLGYEGALKTIGKYIVDKARFKGPPDELVITCKATAPFGIQPWLVRKKRSWEPSTLTAIAETIAKEHGVTLEAPVDISSIATPHIDQIDEADTAMLYRYLRPRGYVLKPTATKLIIAPENFGLVTNADLKDIPTVTIKRSEVSSYSGDWQEGAVYDKVVAWWHDPTTGQVNEETAGTGSRVFRMVTPSANQAEAKAHASGTLKQYLSLAGSMNLTMPGRADLQSEQLVVLEAFPYPLSASPYKDAIAKKWILKSVEHVLTRSGYTTSATGQPFVQPTT